MSTLNYLERLKALCMDSLESGRKRYLIIYVFKKLQSVSPNFQSVKFKIKFLINERRAKICQLPPINLKATVCVSTLVESSFSDVIFRHFRVVIFRRQAGPR